jgi:eukaryotic-like serine/threonine-protein kinase
MGEVFQALDTRLSRRVAIKICTEDFIDRFEQEARSIAVISHPNVCTLYDVGPNYLVMELVEGETLAARLKRGKLSIKETIRLGVQIADALAVVHAQGIVHRDLKPANVMLTKSGVKVLDFGLAKSAAGPCLTEAGGVMGTPAYIAPERFEGKEADSRSDIYSLGLVLAETATGKRSTTAAEDLPPGLDRVVRRCLQADPDERWQSARDVKWELESIALASAVASPRPRKALLPGALATIVFLLAGLVLLYFRRQPANEPMIRVDVLLPEKSLVRSLAVSPDGRFIVTARKTPPFRAGM